MERNCDYNMLYNVPRRYLFIIIVKWIGNTQIIIMERRVVDRTTLYICMHVSA